MSLSKDAKETLAATIADWFRKFTGSTAIDVSQKLSIEHAEVMRLFEELERLGYGSMNANVELSQVILDLNMPSDGLRFEPITTHIFFPSKDALHKAFYESNFPKQQLPEYKKRLMLGAHQIGLAFFSEEVLTRYLATPGYYSVEDSLAGGQISSTSDAPDDRHLWVRYGKCRLNSGRIAVTAIFKDLERMSAPEQRFWHSHEMESPDLDRSDAHFHNFLRRTYDGDFVDFHNPISKLYKAICRINNATGSIEHLFTRSQNDHLRLPAEQTYKAYCDAASELYKLLGPDGLSQRTIKGLLGTMFSVLDVDFVHRDTRRPLSTLQLFSLLEDHLGAPGIYTKPLKMLSELRVDADHRILGPEPSPRSYSREFADICDQFTEILNVLTNHILSKQN
ncbi:hypothetical protein [Geomonas anaerohicana]|uniref:Uncharacterized protein n=1 Tax=Geomonas anaerohicana TaxID=2798583 RepID=A0ABS0YLS5_9BACT|nr:hypothetical protein [Geomonas anaerohicana]MBJ6752824.1 hypothetical protein [Geomonas anaerohicana]